MEQKFEDGQRVKLIGHSDWKYNNRRAGTTGTIFDVFQSEKSGDIVYEVDFEATNTSGSGYQLVHQADLEAE